MLRCWADVALSKAQRCILRGFSCHALTVAACFCTATFFSDEHGIRHKHVSAFTAISGELAQRHSAAAVVLNKANAVRAVTPVAGVQGHRIAFALSVDVAKHPRRLHRVHAAVWAGEVIVQFLELSEVSHAFLCHYLPPKYELPIPAPRDR